MKRLLFCLALLTSFCFAQTGYNSYQSSSFTIPGQATRITQNTTILYHELTWTVTASPASCSIQIDSSPDGTAWTLGGILGATTCTAASGASSIVNAQANFVRVNVTALSLGSQLNIKYIGWSYNPTGGGGSPGGPAGGDLSGTYPNPTVAQVGYDKITAASNLVPKTEGAAGSLAPAAGTNGQVAGSQVWMIPGITTPTGSVSNSGGSLVANHYIQVQIIYNSTLGKTTPSRITSNATSGTFPHTPNPCASGNSCSITITAPVLPAGYTGYTVLACDSDAGGCGSGPQEQAACTNITTNCTLGSIGAGVVAPTINTALISPPNVQAGFVPVSAIPSWFTTKANGNSYPLAVLDFSDGTPLPAPNGTLMFVDRLFINDSGQTIQDQTQQGGGPIRNALFSVAHRAGRTTGTSADIDDRAIAWRFTSAQGDAGVFNQFLGVYGENFIYNDAFACSPIGATGLRGEDCAAALRVRIDDNRVTPAGAITRLVAGHFVANYAETVTGHFGSCTYCVVGLIGEASESATGANAGGSSFLGVGGVASASTSNTNGNGYAVVAAVPTTRFAGSNYGFVAENQGTNVSDWNIDSRSIDSTPSNGRNFFGGNVYLPNLLTAGDGKIEVTGSFDANGYVTTQIAQPAGTVATVTNIGTPGATSYTYHVVAKDAAGGRIAAASAIATATGNATLDGTNFNRLTITTSNQTLGIASYDFYRTISGGTPSSTGKIGTLALTFSRSGAPASAAGFFAALTFDDTGLAGDSTAVPTGNTTGAITTLGPATHPIYKTSTNCAASGTAANPSVVSCSAAIAGAVFCDVAASGGTCTINTTAVTATSRIFVTPSAADGTELSKTCNTGSTITLVPAVLLSAKVAGTSFTINMPTETVNGSCYEYFIVN